MAIVQILTISDFFSGGLHCWDDVHSLEDFVLSLSTISYGRGQQKKYVVPKQIITIFFLQ